MSVFFREFPHEFPILPSVSKFICFFFLLLWYAEFQPYCIEILSQGQLSQYSTIRDFLKQFAVCGLKRQEYCNITISLRVFNFFKLKKQPKKQKITPPLPFSPETSFTKCGKKGASCKNLGVSRAGQANNCSSETWRTHCTLDIICTFIVKQN